MGKRARQCDICGKSYKNLSRHRLIHVTVDECFCSLCKKTFRRVDLCQKHIERVHCPVKVKIVCAICSKAVVNLRKHERRAHERNHPYRCDQCNRSFIWPSYLRSHQQRMHHIEKDDEVETMMVDGGDEIDMVVVSERPKVIDTLSLLVDEMLKY